MSQVYVVPAKYRRVLAAAIAVAVADITKDIKRRERGEPFTRASGIPDELLDTRAIGDAMAFVGPIDDGAAAREAIADAQQRDPFLLQGSNAA